MGNVWCLSLMHNAQRRSITKSMSKKNFVIWIVIIVATFLAVTVGRRFLQGLEPVRWESIAITLASLIVMGVALGTFQLLKRK